MKTITPSFEIETTVAELLKDSTKVEILVVSAVCGGMEDDYQPTGESHQSWEKTTVADFTAKWLGGADDLLDHKMSFANVVSEFYDDFERGYYQAILSPKEANLYRNNEWAKVLNARAASFCAKHKVTIGTIEFFNALRGELRSAKNRMERFFDGESRAERYAQYRACGSDSYWSDNDYMAGKFTKPIEELRELGRFCRLKLPSQYALWRESRTKK